MHLRTVTIATTTTATTLTKAITITITTILQSRKRSCCLCEILKPLMAKHTHTHTRDVKQVTLTYTQQNTAYKTWRWFSAYPMSLPPSRRHSTKSRMINCQNMLGKGKHGEQRIKKKHKTSTNNIIKSAFVCVQMNFFAAPHHTHTLTHTRAHLQHMYLY